MQACQARDLMSRHTIGNLGEAVGQSDFQSHQRLPIGPTLAGIWSKSRQPARSRRAMLTEGANPWPPNWVKFRVSLEKRIARRREGGHTKLHACRMFEAARPTLESTRFFRFRSGVGPGEPKHADSAYRGYSVRVEPKLLAKTAWTKETL